MSRKMPRYRENKVEFQENNLTLLDSAPAAHRSSTNQSDRTINQPLLDSNAGNITT
jgi:hypothetical protein